MMTNQNFERFAEAIKASNASEEAKRFAVDIVSSAQDNPDFDVARFMAACGLMSHEATGRKVTR